MAGIYDSNVSLIYLLALCPSSSEGTACHYHTHHHVSTCSRFVLLSLGAAFRDNYRVIMKI